MGDATGLDRISLACDSDGGLIREGRFLRAALEAADGRIAALEAEAERQAGALRRFGLMFGNICRDLGLEPSDGDADIAAAIEALRAEAAKLRRERDEARARLAEVAEAVEYAGNRWGEWGTRAETVGEMLDHALSGSDGDC